MTRSTLLTTIDDNRRARAVRERARCSRRRVSSSACRFACSTTRARWWPPSASRSSPPSVDDATQTVLVKAPLSATGGRSAPISSCASRSSSRPPGAHGAGRGRHAHQRPVLRVRGRERSRGATVARQRPSRSARFVGNDYLVLGGLKAGEKLIVSGVQKIGDGAPVSDAKPAGQAPGRGGRCSATFFIKRPDPRDRLLAPDHAGGRDRHSDAADRALSGAGAAVRDA